MRKLRPMYDLMLVQPDPAMVITPGGIVIPETARERPRRGHVVAVGNEAPAQISIGDHVLFSRWGGFPVKHDGDEMVLLNPFEIIAVIVHDA